MRLCPKELVGREGSGCLQSRIMCTGTDPCPGHFCGRHCPCLIRIPSLNTPGQLPTASTCVCLPTMDRTGVSIAQLPAVRVGDSELHIPHHSQVSPRMELHLSSSLLQPSGFKSSEELLVLKPFTLLLGEHNRREVKDILNPHKVRWGVVANVHPQGRCLSSSQRRREFSR